MDTAPAIQSYTSHKRAPWRRAAGGASALVISVVSACSLEPSPLPQGAELIVAPPTYQSWWAKTEECSGLEGNLNRIAWYVVPGVSTFPSEIGEVVGFWSRTDAGTRIIVAGDYVMNELVIRHEMLHELLRHAGHPPEYFGERCPLTWATWPDSTGTPPVRQGGI
ncbi:MAG: hypothetical protein ACREMO_00740 [Gemmatimonadales bacterium]